MSVLKLRLRFGTFFAIKLYAPEGGGTKFKHSLPI
jgi:hypothetical protein